MVTQSYGSNLPNVGYACHLEGGSYNQLLGLVLAYVHQDGVIGPDTARGNSPVALTG